MTKAKRRHVLAVIDDLANDPTPDGLAKFRISAKFPYKAGTCQYDAETFTIVYCVEAEGLRILMVVDR